MSGYVFAMAPCFGCGTPFAFNPHLVPSMRDSNNIRQPVCRGCVTRYNAERAKAGLELFKVPKDAYEPLPEAEL